MENLWYSSVKPCEAIELPFGMVSGVTQKNGAFDGVYRSPIRKERFWGFCCSLVCVGVFNGFLTTETYSSGVRKLDNIYVQRYVTGNV